MSLDRANQKLLPHFRSKDFNTSNDAAAEAVRSENQALTSRITYTVPAGQRAKVTVHGSLQIQVTPTSTTSTDKIQILVNITPEGQSIVTVAEIQLSSDANNAGNHDDLEPWTGWLDEGDLLTIQDLFEGDAAGAGRAWIHVGAHIEEFDA